MSFILKFIPWQTIIMFVVTALLKVKAEDVYKIIDRIIVVAQENLGGNEKFELVLKTAKTILTYVKHEMVIKAVIELLVRLLKKMGQIA